MKQEYSVWRRENNLHTAAVCKLLSQHKVNVVFIHFKINVVVVFYSYNPCSEQVLVVALSA